MIEDLAAACRALGLHPTGAQLDALQRYADLLQRWNATYNLTAVRSPSEVLTHHLADCLAVLAPLQRERRGGRLLDVGSGGGLPGVVVAIMLPAWDVTCVDTVGKKAAFIRQAAGVLSLPNLHAAHCRVETMKAVPFDCVTARAFATLADLTRLTRAQVAPGGVWMAMKGRVPDDELVDLPADLEVFHVEQLQVPGLDAQRCLVWIRPRAAPER